MQCCVRAGRSICCGEKNNEKSRNPIAATSQRRRNIGKFIKQRHKFHTQPIIHRSRASC